LPEQESIKPVFMAGFILFRSLIDGKILLVYRDKKR
jgi:hypothetical protein